MTRPWRLTRRQRVEMEYALGRIRGDVGRHRAMYLGGVMAGWSLLSGRPSGEAWSALREIEDGEGGPGIHRVRARVAIALRAALRADEDARCEEVLAQAGGYEVEWDACVSLMREWPEVARGPHPTATARGADVYGWPQTHPCADMRVPALVVPLALWERVDFSPAIPHTSATSRK